MLKFGALTCFHVDSVMVPLVRGLKMDLHDQLDAKWHAMHTCGVISVTFSLIWSDSCFDDDIKNIITYYDWISV